MSTLTEIANRLIETTNCSTDEAISALEESGGNYEKALEIVKSNQKKSSNENKKEEYKVKGKDILELIKKLIKEGNVAKITIKKDNEIILNIPVNAVAVGIVLLPFISMIAGVAAIATDCTIEVQRKGNVVVDVNDKLKKAGSKVENVINDLLKN